METVISAIIADPKTWFGVFSAALVWLYGQIRKAHASHRRCEVDLAVVNMKLAAANEALAVERGRVDMLTDLFKREVNLG